MRRHYDISKLKPAPNPFAARARAVMVRLGGPTAEYFRRLSADTGIPCQRLINLYLDDCARAGRKPEVQWK